MSNADDRDDAPDDQRKDLPENDADAAAGAAARPLMEPSLITKKPGIKPS
ncbi:hypothetical protein L2Y96_08195 [Luteibacter aegosomaticola]|nr:hypothetical protein [Luteibacter aegosomaticola]UPG91732.1 hypothetical protein L2Y96_08195 [Luteibacter aegosomaticola]